MTQCDNGLRTVACCTLVQASDTVAPAMVRLRRVPVLVSTLALVAGCGSADRVEVSGVVRDGRTGLALAGARVTGADGVATHTDADGRFTLAVMRGLRTQLRVSAEGHADAVQSFGADAFVEPSILAFELEPLVVRAVTPTDEGIDPDAVVRWSTADWVAQRFSRGHAETQHDQATATPEAGWIDGGSRDPSRPAACPGAHDLSARRDSVDTPADDPPDTVVTVAGQPAPWLGAGAQCVTCHRDGEAGLEANVVMQGPHAGLGDSCLSCHAEDGAFEPSSCSRCHGSALREDGRALPRGVGDDTSNRTWNVALDVVVPGHPSYERAVSRARERMRARVEPRRRELAAWVEWVERDPSRGAHDPSAVRHLAEVASQPSPH